MAFSVQMPELGESVTEGTITRWLKQEGDTVEVDEPLVEVSTDKVDTEIPSPAAGVLQKIVAAEDDTVEIGAELALIGDEAEAPADDSSGDDSSTEAESTEAESSDDEASDDEATAGTDESAQSEPEADQATRPDVDSESSSGSSEGTPVTMPALGESVTEGTVTRWLKAVGDEVAEDEPLLEVSTDKVDTEIPSPAAGTLLEIVADEDETVEVGGRLAVIGSADQAQAPDRPDAEDEPAEQGDPGSAERAEQEDETPLEEEADTDAAAREQSAQAEDAEKPAHEAPEEEAPKEEPPAAQVESREPAPPEPAGGQQSANGSAVPYVTPLVRKLAAEQDVELADVKGTGVGGRIRKQDVEAAAETKRAETERAETERAETERAGTERAAAPEEPEQTSEPAGRPAAAAAAGVRPELGALRGTTKKASRIRQITAAKTRESLQTTAQLTQTFEVDMSRVAALRARAKAQFREREGVNLTYLPFFALAVVEALKSHPNVNASYDEEAKEITYHGSEHLAIAVDTEAGLLSPVIHNAGDLSLAGLARAVADLASRARSNGLKPDELSGGTFTITNIGSQGALFDTPILVPPQAAMLGTGAIVKRPVVVTDPLGDTIAIRSMCFLPMTYDHRLVDGADAGRFLTTVKQRLEEAAFEPDLGL